MMERATDVRTYLVKHETKYEYSVPVSLCHNTLRLRPRNADYQQVERCYIEIHPTPAIRKTRLDHHANNAEYFSIETQHSEMIVKSECLVKRAKPAISIPADLDFGYLRTISNHPRGPADRAANEYCFDSPYIHAGSEFAEYAIESFKNFNNAFDAVSDLTDRIHKEFKYVPNSTLVSTTPREVLRTRKGVCQDFAHLQIACLRSLGLASRYVSGYLLTHPAPGETKMVGADATHAWISVYMGDAGWVDFDPTNNIIPGNEHITIAWGADYSDVPPVAGTLIGGGGITTLKVSVDVGPAK